MRKIFLILALVVAVSAATVAGTLAVFTGTKTLADNAQVVAATVAVGDVSNMPLKFENVVPGEVKSQQVAIQNGSNVPADMYVYLSSGTQGDYNFAPVAWVEVWDVDASPKQRLYRGLMGNLFKDSVYSWQSAAPLLIANDLGAKATKNYQVDFWLDRNAGNEYQGKYAFSNLNIIAAQSDALLTEVRDAK